MKLPNGINIIFLLITFVFSSFLPASSAVISPKNHPDSLFLKDNPVVDQLDSLVNLTFFNNTSFTTNIAELNKHKFPIDYVPQYSDSIYRERINSMAIGTPFEYVYNQQVKHFIDVYAVKKRNLTSRMLGLAELYFPLFEEQLDIYNIPLELKYLAIIESALNPIARSKAGATGLWQFMLGTGKLYDLKVTSFVDDRCDPYKSTIAACQHLKDLFAIYKDWALCLAAYNAGAGNVNKAIRLSKIDSSEKLTYWKIQSFLPKETQNYVPAFIAASYVMHYAAEHNLYPVQPPILHCEVDSVRLTKEYTLSQISSFLCIPEDNLKFLNPCYRKGIIPATKQNPYVLRLPRENMSDFLVNQEAIYCYKTQQDIMYQAKLRNMPESKTVTKVVAQKVNPVKPSTADSATVTTLVKSNAPTDNTVKTNTPIKKVVYHTVQRGDSLWSIASKYSGVSVEEIRKMNNLSTRTTIHPGQKLKIQVKG